MRDFFVRKRQELVILFAMGLLYFFSFFQRVAVPGTVFDELQTDFATSASTIAGLAAVFLYLYGGVQIGVGMLADRFGGRRTLLIGSTLMIIGSLGYPLSHTLPLLFAFRSLVALGGACIFIAIIKELDTLFDTRDFALLLSAVLFMGYSGGLAATFPLERAVHAVGWRAALLTSGILSVLMLALAALLFHRTRLPHHRQGPSSISLSGIRTILALPDVWPVILTGAINFSIYFLFQASIGKKMLTDAGGYSSSTASGLFFAVMLLCVGFSSAAGFISRWIGNRRKPLITIGTGLMLLALLIMTGVPPYASNPRALMIGLLLMGVAASASPIFSASMKEICPASIAGTSVGILNCISYLCIALFTNGAGWVLDLFSSEAVRTATAVRYPPAAYRMVLIGCLGMAILSCLSSLRIRESRGQCIYRPQRDRA